MKPAEKKLGLLFAYAAITALCIIGTYLGSEAVTVISENLPFTRNHCIVIDAGHGGEDGGALSCTGRKESTFNLQIALRLESLMNLLGYDTLMVRKTDTAVYKAGETISQKKVSDLKERVNIVSKTPNAILLSIHQNTFPESRYSGPQVFFAKTTGSELLAKEIQIKLNEYLAPASTRQIKQGSGIYLLDKIKSTGILIECGFISNEREEALLLEPNYQKKLCSILASTTANFLESP